MLSLPSLHLQDEGCKIFTLWEYKTGPPLSVALNVEGHGNGMRRVCAVKDAGSHRCDPSNVSKRYKNLIVHIYIYILHILHEIYIKLNKYIHIEY